MNADQLVRKVTALTWFTHAAGVEVLSAEPGHVSLSLAKKPELLQFNGYFHGGVVSGWPSSGRGCCEHRICCARYASAVNLHGEAPASGATLVANARALQVGSTICVVAVELETDAATEALVGHRNVARVVDMPLMPAAM